VRVSVPQRAFEVLDKTRHTLTLTKLALSIAQKSIESESLANLLAEILPEMGKVMNSLAVYALAIEKNQEYWYFSDDAPKDLQHQIQENDWMAGNISSQRTAIQWIGNVLRFIIPSGNQAAAVILIITRHPWSESAENQDILNNIVACLTSVVERETNSHRMQQTSRTIQDIECVLNIASIVMILDHRGFITYVNDKYCELSQYSREEIGGKHISQFQNGHLKRLANYLKQGQTWHGEIQNRKKDQSDYWLDVTIMPFQDEGGKPYQYVVIGHDITEQEHTLQALKDSERRKELFVATLTHDLKTPIQSELKVLEHLIQGHLGKLNDTQMDVVQELSRSNRYLYHMVNNVLSTYRFEEGKIRLYKECIDLNEMIQQVLTGYVRTLAKEKNITFEQRLAPGSCVILVDQIELKRVIYNLIQNAIHHSPPNEEIIVYTKIIKQPGEYDSNVEISIEDHGPGISQQQQQNLFKPYSVVKTFRPVGTGLGLYLSKQIIEAHRGIIGVDSNPAQGSRFFFQLRMVNTSHLPQMAIQPPHISQKTEDPKAIDAQEQIANNDTNALKIPTRESGCLKFLNS